MAKIHSRCANPDFLSLYRKMRAGGITDIKLDAMDGNPDGAVECRGIAEAALEHAERYGEYIEKITGRKVSWILDEKTKKDARMISGMARSALVRQGCRPGSEDFERQMAYVLVRFAFAPAADERKRIAYYDKQWLDAVSARPFLDMGMAPIARFIEKNGGLGLINPPVANEYEATAKDFLKDGKGLCTARSKVLYAVLKEGGLKPFFAHMRPEDIKRNAARMLNMSSKSRPPAAGDYFGGHIFVGVMIAQNPLYIEPNDFAFDVNYDEYARRISLTEMHQTDISNLIAGIRTHDNKLPPEFASSGVTIEKLVDGASALGRSGLLAYTFSTEGEFRRKNRNYESAIRYFEEALQCDPHHTQSAIAICLTREQQGDAEEAKACYDKLPDDADLKEIGIANYYSANKDYARARESMKKALELGAAAHDINKTIAATFLEEKNYAKAEEHMRKAAAEKPFSFPDAFILGDILARGEKWQEAADALKGAIAIDSTNFDAPRLMAKTLIKLGRLDEARRYASRLFLIFAAAANPFPPPGEEVFEELRGIAEKLGMWRDFAAVMGTLWDKGLRSPYTLILMTEAECGAGIKDRAAGVFGFLETITDPSFSVPPQHYKRLAAIAECSNLWANLARVCMKNVQASEYNIYMLHAAVKSGDESLIRGAAEKSQAFADKLAGINPAEINIDTLDRLHAAIIDMPRGIGSHPLIRPVFAKHLGIIADIYSAVGNKEAAAKAKRQAGFCGAK